MRSFFQLHDRVNNLQILSVAPKCFCGEFLSPAKIKRTQVFKRSVRNFCQSHLDFLDRFSWVDADNKCPYILQTEVEKAVKNIRRDQKTKGYDEVPGNVLRLLGKDGLRLKTQLIKTYMNLDSGPRVSLNDCKKEAKAMQCGDHRTISLRGYLKEELRGNLRTYLENTSLDLRGRVK